MYNKIGIILFLAMYVLSGINKGLKFMPTVKLTQSKFPIKFPLWFFQLAIIGVVLLLTMGSGLMVYSTYTNKLRKYSYYTTILMIIFTIMATLMFHPPFGKEKYHFQKNLSIVGGFIILMGTYV